jgi:hypothetical protein
MSSDRRFLVVDLGTQIDANRRFTVWDFTTSRFWKINNRQTWRSVTELVEDFSALTPEEKFRAGFLAQRDEIATLATILGFDDE